MSLPALLTLADEASYRAHFNARYCNVSIVTFDGVAVQFFPKMFDHAFYRDSSPTARDKVIFDLQRAQRMDWINAMLANPSMELYRRVMPNLKVRRIALEATERYAVIIQMGKNSSQARFTTAYIVDSNSALAKMRSNPRW